MYRKCSSGSNCWLLMAGKPQSEGYPKAVASHFLAKQLYKKELVALKNKGLQIDNHLKSFINQRNTLSNS